MHRVLPGVLSRSSVVSGRRVSGGADARAGAVAVNGSVKGGVAVRRWTDVGVPVDLWPRFACTVLCWLGGCGRGARRSDPVYVSGIGIQAQPPAWPTWSPAEGKVWEGSTLTAVPGTWTGTGTISFGYEWSHGDDVVPLAQPVGVGSTYTVSGSDVGSVPLVAGDGDGCGREQLALFVAGRAGWSTGLRAWCVRHGSSAIRSSATPWSSTTATGTSSARQSGNRSPTGTGGGPATNGPRRTRCRGKRATAVPSTGTRPFPARVIGATIPDWMYDPTSFKSLSVFAMVLVSIPDGAGGIVQANEPGLLGGRADERHGADHAAGRAEHHSRADAARGR